MTHLLGRKAEHAAAKYLAKNSYKIHVLNWRTRKCEIDIVASKQRAIYFVEVKYRSRSGQGTGLDYITEAKLKQMSYAANVFMAKYQLDYQYYLAAVSVGPNFEILNYFVLDA